MIKNIISWFALMVLAGVLSACGQQNQGGDQGAGTGDQGQQQESAPAEGTQPSTPAGQ